MKICTKCKIQQPLSSFNKQKINKDGLKSVCKDCCCAANKSRYAKNHVKINAAAKAWAKANSDKVRAAKKAYQAANFDKIIATKKAYRAENSDKIKASNKAYRCANIGKKKVADEAYRKANPKKMKSMKRAYYEANIDKIKAAVKAWQVANPERHTDIKRNGNLKRRARESGCEGSLSKGLFDKLFALQRGKCPICKAGLSNIKPRSPMDHVMPLALNGSNTDDNIQILCRTCNQRKHARDPIEFMQSKGFLL